MLTDRMFRDALARLDAEIAETEAQLKHLRVKRQGADAFLQYAQSERGERGDIPRATGVNTGKTALIESVMRKSGGRPVSVEDVLRDSSVQDAGLDRDQVRNGLHYLSRKRIVEGAGPRGVWRLVGADQAEASPIDTSATVTAVAKVPAPATGTGGDPHAQTDQDHGDNLARRNRDDRSGAAVMEASTY